MGPGEIQHDWLVRGRDGSCEVVINFFSLDMFVFLCLTPLAKFCAFSFFFAGVFCLILMVAACTAAQRTHYECTAGSLTAALM